MTGARLRAEEPLVSVIIPAYNAQLTLPATLRSVLAQTHRRLEVLLVDDGSSDGTADIARRFSAADPRLRILAQANAGLARARNLALAQASGRYVAWCDADDLWHPTKIARQMEIFCRAKEPLSFVYTGYRLIDEADRILPNHRPLTDMSGQTLCRQIASNFFSNTSSIVVPTELARSIGGHDPRLRDWNAEGAEDLLFQLQLTMAGPVKCCRSALVGYRMHSSNMSYGFARAARSNLKVLDLVEESAPQIPAWVFAEGRARVVGYAAFLLKAGDLNAAAATLGSILRRQPVATVSMCGRLLGHVLRDAVLGPRQPDPALGQRFIDADPGTAPWGPHILMTSRTRNRLDALDRSLAGLHGTSLLRTSHLSGGASHKSGRGDQNRQARTDLRAASAQDQFSIGSPRS